jgi:hypothetical protein
MRVAKEFTRKTEKDAVKILYRVAGIARRCVDLTMDRNRQMAIETRQAAGSVNIQVQRRCEAMTIASETSAGHLALAPTQGHRAVRAGVAATNKVH